MSKSMTPFSNLESNFGSIMEKQSGDTSVMNVGPSADPVEQPLSISQVELDSTVVESEPANAKDTGGFSNIDDGSDEEYPEPSPVTDPSDFSAVVEEETEPDVPNESDESDKPSETENFSQNIFLKYLFRFIFSLSLILSILFYIYPSIFTVMFPRIVSYFTKVDPPK